MKTCKFMNGWIVKEKHINMVIHALEQGKRGNLYVYGYEVKVEISGAYDYEGAIDNLNGFYNNRIIKRTNDFVVMKAGTKYLVVDATMFCESISEKIDCDNYYNLDYLLEGKF